MKDPRLAEIVWLTVIAIVVAAGGNVVLAMLAAHRGYAAVLLLIVLLLALLNLRRAFLASAPTARIDTTKAATYLAAAVLAFVAIGLHVHWAIGATIAAAEAALVFDILTIAARKSNGAPPQAARPPR